jgi:hypothetical protein
MQRECEKGIGSREQGVGRRKLFRRPQCPIPIPYSLFVSFALFVFFASLFPLFAQQPRRADVVQLGQEFELKINQEAMLEGEGLAVAFESVLEDSRCPVDVTCVWSGNAKIRLRSTKQKQTPAAVELNTDIKPKSSSYLDYEIKLVALKPARKKDKAIQPAEYIATLIVTKK